MAHAKDYGTTDANPDGRVPNEYHFGEVIMNQMQKYFYAPRANRERKGREITIIPQSNQ